MAGTAAAALFNFRFQPVAFEDAESIGAHARVALWRRRRGGAGLLALAAVWVISRRSALTIGATAAVIGGLLVSHHAYVYDAVLLLPACALVLRLPAPKALRYGALLLCVPIPYVLLMQEHGAWVVAQLSINGFGMLLLGLLAFHGLRVSARTQPVVHGVAAGDGLRFH